MKIEAALLAYAVLALLCGSKTGPYLMVAVTILTLTFEANPIANYAFEVDKTEAIR